MRTVRSLLFLMSQFAPAFQEVLIITDEETPFAEGQREELEKAGLRFRISADLDNELPNLDVVYMTNFNCGPDSFLLTYAEEILGNLLRGRRREVEVARREEGDRRRLGAGGGGRDRPARRSNAGRAQATARFDPSGTLA